MKNKSLTKKDAFLDIKKHFAIVSVEQGRMLESAQQGQEAAIQKYIEHLPLYFKAAEVMLKAEEVFKNNKSKRRSI